MTQSKTAPPDGRKKGHTPTTLAEPPSSTSASFAPFQFKEADTLSAEHKLVASSLSSSTLSTTTLTAAAKAQKGGGPDLSALGDAKGGAAAPPGKGGAGAPKAGSAPKAGAAPKATPKGGSSAASKGGSKAGAAGPSDAKAPAGGSSAKGGAKGGESVAGVAGAASSKGGADAKAGSASKSGAKGGAATAAAAPGAASAATAAPPPFDPGVSPTDRSAQQEVAGSYPTLDSMAGMAGMAGMAMGAMGGDMEEKGGKPIYTYHRSDMDRESPLYIPPSLRQRWRVRFPSRFEVGSPLPQDGFKPAGGEAGGEAAGGSPRHTLQGMPLDFFPNPIDPPIYTETKIEDGQIGGE